MQAVHITSEVQTPSKAALWTGRIIGILVILFMLVDAIMKVIKAAPAMEGSVQLGWPADAVQGIGIALLLSTILYIIPRTAILGAILLTGYLGGATAVMVRAGQPIYFCLIMGILTWAALYLTDPAVRKLIPLHK